MVSRMRRRRARGGRQGEGRGGGGARESDVVRGEGLGRRRRTLLSHSWSLAQLSHCAAPSCGLNASSSKAAAARERAPAPTALGGFGGVDGDRVNITVAATATSSTTIDRGPPGSLICCCLDFARRLAASAAPVAPAAKLAAGVPLPPPPPPPDLFLPMRVPHKKPSNYAVFGACSFALHRVNVTKTTYRRLSALANRRPQKFVVRRLWNSCRRSGAQQS